MEGATERVAGRCRRRRRRRRPWIFWGVLRPIKAFSIKRAVCSYYCRNWQRADNGKYHASADESSVKAEAVAQLVCQDAVDLLGEHPHLQDCHEEEQHGESVATRLCKVVVRSIFVGRRDGNEQRKRGRNDERGDYLQD